jgi:hypothetical protein
MMDIRSWYILTVLKEIDSNLEAYLIDRSPGATPKLEAMFYAFLDVPIFGSNKINALETRPDVIYDLKTQNEQLKGDYKFASGSTHLFYGEKLVGTFSISKGNAATAEFEIKDRS